MTIAMSNPSRPRDSQPKHHYGPPVAGPQAFGQQTRVSGRALRVQAFNSFPDLAAWCRPRVPESDRQRFAMGHGDAFVALLRFMSAHPGADLALVALSEPCSDDQPEQARIVFACVRHADWPMLAMPAGAVLLYERMD